MMKDKHSKPLIAVTGPVTKMPVGWWAANFCLALQGAKAKYLTAESQFSPESFQGIIIGGGDDIEPEHYGLTGDAGAKYDAARDAFELKMLEHAAKAKIPVLGICRGAQLINIFMGGSLFQDIRPHRKLTPNRNTIFRIKDAEVYPQTHLYTVLQEKNIAINSLHNQAIDRLGRDIVVSARDKDGFVQAIEAQNLDIMGVQWHPEYLPYASAHRRIFSSFVQRVYKSDEDLVFSKPSSR